MGTQLERPFYASAIGHRWASCPVAFASLDDAIECAIRTSADCFEARVHDCSQNFAGRLVGRAVRGQWQPADEAAAR